MKIVLASHNKGKIQEVTDILAPFGIEVEPIPEDFPEIEEDEPPYRLLCSEYPAAKEN